MIYNSSVINMNIKKILAPTLIIILQGCTTNTYVKEKVEYQQLPGWSNGNQIGAIAALKNSCINIIANKKSTSNWKKVCNNIIKKKFTNTTKSRHFIEKNFTPYKISVKDYSDGHFTGYYQPSIEGSRVKTKKFITPIYKKPDDLIVKKKKNNQSVFGRKQNGMFTPYYSRKEISNNNLIPKKYIIAWLPSRIDRTFLQIQGSGQIRFQDGTKILVGYDGQNGHPYKPIGKLLLENNEIPRHEISMQSIKAWLIANPKKASDVLNYDPSFVFFRVLNNKQPIGAQGIELTPKVSMAIDWRYTKYGTPIWLDTQYKTSDGTNHQFRKLMIAQDTGGAIRGPNRGDIFWGEGLEAEYIAGHMNNKGKMWVLLPN